MNTEKSEMCLRGTGDLGEGRGFQVEEFSAEEKDDMKIKYTQSEHTQNLIKLGPEKWVLPDGYLKYAHPIYNFKIRSDDTFIMTSPKSGTIWMGEVVWTMRNNPNLDNPLAKKAPFDRSVHLESDIHLKADNPFEDRYRRENQESVDDSREEGLFLQICNAGKSPRVFTTHLPFEFFRSDMLDRCKVIYVARNPYDVVISFYHFVKLFSVLNFAGNFDEYLDYFMQAKLIYTPYWPHVKQAWQKREHPNLHFVFYEDLKKSPESEIRKIDKFLQTNLTDQQIQNVLFHTSFENMQKVDTNGARPPLFQEFIIDGKVGGFFRKGQAGGWKTVLNAEQKSKISQWIDENTKDSDIKFKYE